MANCVLCNAYYKNHSYNNSKLCDFCQEEKEDWYGHEEDEVDIMQVINPTGKTPARYNDE